MYFGRLPGHITLMPPNHKVATGLSKLAMFFKGTSAHGSYLWSGPRDAHLCAAVAFRGRECRCQARRRQMLGPPCCAEVGNLVDYRHVGSTYRLRDKEIHHKGTITILQWKGYHEVEMTGNSLMGVFDFCR